MPLYSKEPRSVPSVSGYSSLLADVLPRDFIVGVTDTLSEIVPVGLHGVFDSPFECLLPASC